MMFVRPIDIISLFPSSWYPLMDAKDRPTAIDSYNGLYRINMKWKIRKQKYN